MIPTEPKQFPTEHTHQHYVDTGHLNTVESTKENIWEVKVTVDNTVIKFKVDTGAEVTVASKETWKMLYLSEPLQKPSSSL